MVQVIYTFAILATLGGDVSTPQSGHYTLFDARAESGEAYECEARVMSGGTELVVQCSDANDGNDVNEYEAIATYEDGEGVVLVSLPGGLEFLLHAKKN